MLQLSWMKKTVKEVFQDNKSVSETIEEIHNSFDIASELALKEAKEILSKPIMSNEEKIQKMMSLGFTNAKGIDKYKEETNDKRLKEQEIAFISEWSQKYPQYKFILERQVEDICEKYSLVCGPSNRYKGDIPMKNLLEIESFKIREEDERYETSSWGRKSYKSKKELLFSNYTYDKDMNWFHEDYDRVYRKSSFEICAPISDMNTRGMKLEGHKLVQEIPDPIVLYPVNGGYLIVSKWGLEGDDPSLVNEVMN